MKDPVPVERFRNDLPPPLLPVVFRMMAKQPRERFQTPTEVACALHGIISAAPVALPARPAPPPDSRASVTVRSPAVPATSARTAVLRTAITRARPFDRLRDWLPRRPRWRRVVAAGGAVLGLILLIWMLTFEKEKDDMVQTARDRPSSTASAPSGAKVYLLDLKPGPIRGVVWTTGKYPAGEPIYWGAGLTTKSMIFQCNKTVRESSITFTLGHQYRRFVTTVASFDKNSPPWVFKVMGNGKELWKSDLGKRDSQQCAIDVGGVDVLELVLLLNPPPDLPADFGQGLCVDPYLMK
jgi:hypothetical protein